MNSEPAQQPSVSVMARIRRIWALTSSLDRRRLRQAVRAISWLILAMIFAGSKWATEHYLSATLTQGLMAGFASALVIGLVFHVFHHRIEQGVDRLASRRTRARETALRDLATEIAFIKDRQTLVQRVVTGVQRLLETEGAAVYLRHDTDMYRLVHSTLESPQVVDADDSAVIQIRVHRTHMPVLNSASALSGAFLWPLFAHGDELLGFFLSGNRGHAESFDDEELSAVSTVVNALAASLSQSVESMSSHSSTLAPQQEDRGTVGMSIQPAVLGQIGTREPGNAGSRSIANRPAGAALATPKASHSPGFAKSTIAIVAHCDDLELGAGGTIAKLVEEQWDVHVVVIESQARLPSEERKRIAENPASPNLEANRQEKMKLRESEALAGARILGVKSEHVLFLRASEESGSWQTRVIVSHIHDYCERIFGVRKCEFPFVFTHTRNDRHPQHAQANEIARSAFRTPLLCFRVASSTEDTFDPVIGVNITRWIDAKQQAFEAHKSQSGLKFASGRLAVESIKDEAGEWSAVARFPYGEYFECDLTLDVGVDQLEPLVGLSDSDHHFQKLLKRLSSVRPPEVAHSWSGRLTRLRASKRHDLIPSHPRVQIQLRPSSAVADALRSGRLPFSFSMTAIDGCAEVMATPDEKSRYAGFTRDQVECFRVEHFWSPASDSSEPHQVRVAMMAALDDWRNQSNVPKVLRTLRAAPMEPVSDRRSLRLVLGQSDYFTVRTVTQIIRSGSIAQLERLFPARNWWATAPSSFALDVPPYHVSVQGIILNHDTNNGEWTLVLTAYAGQISPIAGGISVGIAEQMAGRVNDHQRLAWWYEDKGEADVLPVGNEDCHIFDTMERGLHEELGLQGNDHSPPLLLNASLEADMFFLTFLFLVRTDQPTQSIFEKWRTAPDRGEADVIALYPICNDDDGGLESERAIDRVVELMGREFVDLEPYVLPAPLQPGRLGARKWHHSSRMRLYVLARHLWGAAIESRVRLNMPE